MIYQVIRKKNGMFIIFDKVDDVIYYIHKSIWAVTCDYQQCGILTIVVSDKHVQPPFYAKKLQMTFSQ